MSFYVYNARNRGSSQAIILWQPLDDGNMKTYQQLKNLSSTLEDLLKCATVAGVWPSEEVGVANVDMELHPSCSFRELPLSSSTSSGIFRTPILSNFA